MRNCAQVKDIVLRSSDYGAIVSSFVNQLGMRKVNRLHADFPVNFLSIAGAIDSARANFLSDQL